MTTSTSDPTATATSVPQSDPDGERRGSHPISRPPLAEVGRRTPREWGALGVLLAGSALLNLWGLGASGNANDFYAAAVQAGTKSWKAMLFGSVSTMLDGEG